MGKVNDGKWVEKIGSSGFQIRDSNKGPVKVGPFRFKSVMDFKRAESLAQHHLPAQVDSTEAKAPPTVDNRMAMPTVTDVVRRLQREDFETGLNSLDEELQRKLVVEVEEGNCDVAIVAKEWYEKGNISHKNSMMAFFGGGGVVHGETTFSESGRSSFRPVSWFTK
ncbi:unnamed protein product [Ilex paraguariensis]|uniref:Uncharacterized protein n=1 Tax=Ilex paraguariensis TaxID=185542 RepID=A0ABC8T8D3_9AQUA